ncbi:MAG: prephenate dehydrogenase/arogenate dehydrogenase family protein [Methanomassiliicoccaceae archaeon]|nr:prephenate dehydrogenase/arogenate dehydrogenase family protein [Methanomassiliicoccaceae archaeon]
MKDIESMKEEIEVIDSMIVKLMIQRSDIAKRIGVMKNELGIPLRDEDAEKKEIERCRTMSKNSSLPQGASESICNVLTASSAELQSTAIIKWCQKRVTIIGGNGQMGRWMRRYFRRRGAVVNIVDVSEGSMEDAADSDVVVISVPISSVESVLKAADAICKKDALIFDIASVKSSFTDDLRKMAEHRKVCSVHPMFGPSAASMFDRSVVICDCGCSNAADEAAELFNDEGSNIIVTTVERHDELMAYVLALAHASNVVFFTTLRESGIPFNELKGVASTTFKRCLDACVPLSKENASLYHEIQNLNGNAESMWNIYEGAVREVREASLSENPEKFIKLMKKGKEYLSKSRV